MELPNSSAAGINKLGQTDITYRTASTILTPAKGFMDGYDFTLNPYSGCAFGCTYCYAASFARSRELKENWGYWVQVKENALDILKKFRSKGLADKTIYMSSVTDPYQPIESKLRLTRSLLQELLDFHQPRLVIQTRSPLITDDIELLKQFKHLQVNMTVTTDSERVRRIFEPLCPSNQTRLAAITKVGQAGIKTCITITPLLPVESVDRFVEGLLATGASKFVIQPFHADKGKFVAKTGAKALALVGEMNWNYARYEEVLQAISKCIPDIVIGKQGFEPI